MLSCYFGDYPSLVVRVPPVVAAAVLDGVGNDVFS